MRSEQETADAPVVYAIGDIHGQAGLLARLHAGIAADSRKYPGRDKILVHLGDYVDRGPGSRAVIERVRQGLPGFRTINLRGNHEQMMLDAVRTQDSLAISNWILNGGRSVLEDYGADGGSQRAAVQQLAELAQDDLAWMDGLPYVHREGLYLFVHAGIMPGRPLEQQRLQDLIWIRDAFLNDRRDHGFVVVHGHTPRDVMSEVENNRINLDTRAAYGGPLTAAVLDPSGAAPPRFLQAHPK